MNLFIYNSINPSCHLSSIKPTIQPTGLPHLEVTGLPAASIQQRPSADGGRVSPSKDLQHPKGAASTPLPGICVCSTRYTVHAINTTWTS